MSMKITVKANHASTCMYDVFSNVRRTQIYYCNRFCSNGQTKTQTAEWDSIGCYNIKNPDDSKDYRTWRYLDVNVGS